MASKEFESRRAAMVRHQLVERGISDPAVIAAMTTVPRHLFVAEDMAHLAYADMPLPTEDGQTISQPFMVAFMTEALELEPNDRVLEIGTGSGYSSAVLAEIAHEIFSIERLSGLAASAQRRLRRLGYGRVHVRCGDGTLGWPEEAPFDAIVVAAGGPDVPGPLLDQLAEGGRLVIPVGRSQFEQILVRVRREGGRLKQERMAEVRFVPLIGARGW